MLFFKKMYRDFVQWSVISAVVILVPMTILDSSHYGRVVVAPWNLVKYNVFGGAGPNLYGTEPTSFYFINGFLNFNIVWVGIHKCHSCGFFQDLTMKIKLIICIFT